LLAGNTIIFKPSEWTPLIGEFLVRAFEQAGLPAGVINLIQGGKEAGKEIVQHPRLKGLYFTGSYQAGLFLSKLFGATPDKILALEMGGNNPLIVSNVDNIQAAASLAVQSAYLSSGQRCTCARRLIVPRSHQGDAFVDVFQTLVHRIKVGPYTDRPEPFMGPVIHNSQAAHLLKIQRELQSLGGIPLIPMKQLIDETPFLSPGLIDVTEVSLRPDEEYFGPLLQLIRVADFEEAVREANHTKFGLSAGLFSDLEEEYRYFFDHIRAGIVNWNAPLTGASSRGPFGGIGCSGNNRPSAYFAVDYCAYPVASIEFPILMDQKKSLPGI
jgi:succinylglutamic semialdehyde dehydrogenase